MPSRHTVVLQGPPAVVEATPLTRDAFAPFGDVVENPHPRLHPFSFDQAPSPLLFSAVSANQGSAIKYQHVSHQINLYEQAPSGRPGSAIMSMFVCAARARLPDSHEEEQSAPGPAPTATPALAPAPAPTTAAALPRTGPSPPDSPPGSSPPGKLPIAFPVTVLERHPFTTQTFIPLSKGPAAPHYLVIVAPTLPATTANASAFAVPSHLPRLADYPRPLPGAGLPDISRLRAFVAGPGQAVTYGAGTWHAPMVALGERGTAVDFVVMQFANGVGDEDCQEVFFELERQVDAAAGRGEENVAPPPVLVRLRPLPVAVTGEGLRETTAKL
ncbi:hypothetical protein VTJ83DRAFT_7422 [Remersonia thermophila]|uniref:Ureidoglycolate hydrolase n=1 Tax=Remersonia thermophila TaxID=72144 RepID=A0ABR4D3P7_9PEZI